MAAKRDKKVGTSKTKDKFDCLSTKIFFNNLLSNSGSYQFPT